MAGYSQTPLLQKLGIKPGYRVWLLHPPDHYVALLGPLPEGVELVNDAGQICNFIHFFTCTQADLIATFPTLKASLAKDGMVWVSWPKKTAKLPGDLDENVVREIGLGYGLVDVKVAAIDNVWSGLKFVYRLKDR